MGNYEIRAKCEIEKRVWVRGKNKKEAIEEFNKGNWIDEEDVKLINWNMWGEPKKEV